HHTFAADFADFGVVEAANLVDQVGADLGAVVKQVVLFEGFKRGERRRAGERVAAEGGTVDTAGQLFGDLGRHEGRADRHTVAESLGGHEQIGNDTGVLARE